MLRVYSVRSNIIQLMHAAFGAFHNLQCWERKKMLLISVSSPSGSKCFVLKTSKQERIAHEKGFPQGKAIGLVIRAFLWSATRVTLPAQKCFTMGGDDCFVVTIYSNPVRPLQLQANKNTRVTSGIRMSATVVFFHVSAFMVSCAVTCGKHAGQCWQKSDWYVWACGKILRSQQGFSHTRSTHLIWSILSSHTRAWMMEKHTIKPEKKNPSLSV